MNTRKQTAEANINNLYRKYKNYDARKTRYAFDIRYTTLHTQGETCLSKRETGADTFMELMRDLMDNYCDVSSIIVTDYGGTNAKAVRLNPPVTIELMDIQIPRIMSDEPDPNAAKTGSMEALQGLSGLFAGTEFEGLGNLAPVAKFIDDKHRIDRLQEKNEELKVLNTQLEHQMAGLSGRLEALREQYNQLEDDAGDMADELETYRNQDRKQDKWVSMIGLAGASVAKNFLKQNPGILSGFIPAEQLAGILAEDESGQEPVPVQLSDAQQARLDDATMVFEWLQTLDDKAFEQVVSVIALMRQNTDHAARIISLIRGSGHSLIQS